MTGWSLRDPPGQEKRSGGGEMKFLRSRKRGVRRGGGTCSGARERGTGLRRPTTCQDEKDGNHYSNKSEKCGTAERQVLIKSILMRVTAPWHIKKARTEKSRGATFGAIEAVFSQSQLGDDKNEFEKHSGGGKGGLSSSEEGVET